MGNDDGYRGLVVKPGDTVLIGLPETVTERDLNSIAKRIHEALPDDVKVVVVRGAQFAVHSPNNAPPVEAPCGHD